MSLFRRARTRRLSQSDLAAIQTRVAALQDAPTDAKSIEAEPSDRLPLELLEAAG